MTGLIVKTTAAALVVVALALFVTTDLARRLAAPQAPVETQAPRLPSMPRALRAQAAAANG